MKKQIFLTAWQLFKSNVFSTFSEALKAAWQRSKVTAALRAGIAYFTFKKEDGTDRQAIGTLREGNFTYNYKNNGHGNNNPNVVRYFDIEKKSFRSFRLDRLVCIG